MLRIQGEISNFKAETLHTKWQNCTVKFPRRTIVENTSIIKRNRVLCRTATAPSLGRVCECIMEDGIQAGEASWESEHLARTHAVS